MRKIAPALLMTLLIGCAAPTEPSAMTAALSSDAYLLLPPVRDDGPETLLVIFPGAKLPPEDYVDLTRALQQITPLKLWVGIARFAFDMPQPVQAGSRFDGIVAAARAQGFTPTTYEQVFLAGHSLGGIIAKDTARNEHVGGLLLFGSYLPKLIGSPRLPDYPLPVLTLGGEIDGRTWITRLAEEVALQSDDKPVVILPGVDHFQFAGGEPDSEDIAPELPLDEAHRRIAATVRDFLVARVSASPVAQQALATSVQATRALVAGYQEAQQLDAGHWCELAQSQLAGVADGVIAVHDQSFADPATFALSKPHLAADGSSAETRSLLAYAPDPIDSSPSTPKAAVALACKLKSRESVAAALPGATAAGEGSCNAINQAVFSWALDHVTPAARARYLARGQALQFLDDHDHSTGVTWLAAPLSFEHGVVQSQALHTDLGAAFGLGGMHYCKLLAPSRAVEWILVSSLKP
jgi:hypothetical protein